MEEVRDKVYDWSLELVNEGKILQGIFLMLATWNFAYFRYHMKDFKLKKFERTLENCSFNYFKKLKFEKVDFNEKQIQDKTMKIYRDLSNFKGIRYVGATKIMHLMCPEFFVMWDKSIREHYKFKTSPEGYIDFLEKMQRMYLSNEFKKLDKTVTIPRAIDLYNITHYPPK